MEINAVTKRLLEGLETTQQRSGRQLLTAIAADMSHPDVEVVIGGGFEILRKCARRMFFWAPRRR